MKKPKYIEVAKKIEKDINDGQYKIKEKLPSERDLAQLFEVSRMTARQAIIHLEEKKMVYREMGSGTFVQAPSFQQNNVKSFTETLEDMGYSVSTRLLEFTKVYNIEKFARSLDLPLSSSYYKMKRLRLGNGIPMALEVLYIPVEYCEDLEQYDLEKSLYQLLETKYGLKISKVSYKMEAVIANAFFTKIFELKKTTALLKVSGVSFDHHQRKIIYEESCYRSDLYNYHVDIHRKF
jgi:GntR family transcriptional regulator